MASTRWSRSSAATAKPKSSTRAGPTFRRTLSRHPSSRMTARRIPRMSDERVQIDVAGGVASVRMVRADKHNALDWPMFLALDAVTDELAERDDVRCVVLSGDGPSFCSGLDFPSFM